MLQFKKSAYIVSAKSRYIVLGKVIASQAGRIGYSAAIRQAKNKGFSFEQVLGAVRSAKLQAVR